MSAKKKKSKLFTKVILIFVFLVFIIISIVAYDLYLRIFKENVLIDKNDEYIYIPTGSTFEDVVKILQKENILKDISSFEWIGR